MFTTLRKSVNANGNLALFANRDGKWRKVTADLATGRMQKNCVYMDPQVVPGLTADLRYINACMYMPAATVENGVFYPMIRLADDFIDQLEVM